MAGASATGASGGTSVGIIGATGASAACGAGGSKSFAVEDEGIACWQYFQSSSSSALGTASLRHTEAWQNLTPSTPFLCWPLHRIHRLRHKRLCPPPPQTQRDASAREA